MFALEIDFQDGVSPSETIFIRRPRALIGQSEFAHVVIDATGFMEFRLLRGLGREFRCEAVHSGGVSREFFEGLYLGEAEFSFEGAHIRVTSLDSDLSLSEGESPDSAGVRVLRRALSFRSPKFPAVALTGNESICISLPEDEPILIGRSRKCLFRLDSPDISSEHARVGFAQGQFWIEDLGSTNGTYIGDDEKKRVSGRATLKAGEHFYLRNDISFSGILSEKDLPQKNSSEYANSSSQANDPYPCLISEAECVRPKRVLFPRQGKIIAGRDPSCDLWIAASHVSRNHAEFEIEESGGLTVTDLSTNGTHIITDGEKIRLPRDIPYAISGIKSTLDFGGGIIVTLCFSKEDELLLDESHQKVEDKSTATESLSPAQVADILSDHKDKISAGISGQYQELLQALKEDKPKGNTTLEPINTHMVSYESERNQDESYHEPVLDLADRASMGKFNEDFEEDVKQDIESDKGKKFRYKSELTEDTSARYDDNTASFGRPVSIFGQWQFFLALIIAVGLLLLIVFADFSELFQ